MSEINNTDKGNAHRLANLYGDNFRYNGTTKAWMVWDGSAWIEDQYGRIMEAAKATVEAMDAEARQIEDSEARDKARKWALRSESATRLRAMVELARSEGDIPVTEFDFDTDPWLLNCNNGVVDLRTGTLLEHDPARMMTKLAPVDYDPDAEAPQWETFLEQILPDPEVRDFVAKAVGYSLTGLSVEEILMVLFGTGANGKSKFLEAIKAALGTYATQAEPDLLLARRDAHPTGVADLRGKRIVMTSETDGGRRFAEATVKRLTGGDTIKARYMYGNFFEFEPTHTIWMATNYRPEVRGTDDGIWRRLRVVPFEVQIPEDQRDTELGAKLAAEAPGILAWAVRACLRWQAEGLKAPAAVTMATDTYRLEQDNVAAFLDECCTRSEHGRDSARNLWDAWSKWAAGNGYDVRSQTWFGTELARRGFDKFKDESTRRVSYMGLEVRHLEVSAWD